MGELHSILKNCACCKTDLPLSSFTKDRKRPDGKNPYCKPCVAMKVKKYRAKPGVRDKINESRRKLRIRKPGRHWKEYGINMTAEEYNERFIQQQGCCVLCGVHQSLLSKRLCVDHNHETGQSRGLLCVPCNTLVGIVESKFDQIKKAKKYLKHWKNKEDKNGVSLDLQNRRQLSIFNSLS